MTIIQTGIAVVGFVLCLPFVGLWVVLAMVRDRKEPQVAVTSAVPLRAAPRLGPINVG